MQKTVKEEFKEAQKIVDDSKSKPFTPIGSVLHRFDTLSTEEFIKWLKFQRDNLILLHEELQFYEDAYIIGLESNSYDKHLLIRNYKQGVNTWISH